MTKLYMKHIRQCRYCVPEFIKFCQERNLDYVNFFKNGIEIDELKKLLNGEETTLVSRAIKCAMEDNNGE